MSIEPGVSLFTAGTQIGPGQPKSTDGTEPPAFDDLAIRWVGEVPRQWFIVTLAQTPDGLQFAGAFVNGEAVRFDTTPTGTSSRDYGPIANATLRYTGGVTSAAYGGYKLSAGGYVRPETPNATAWFAIGASEAGILDLKLGPVAVGDVRFSTDPVPLAAQSSVSEFNLAFWQRSGNLPASVHTLASKSLDFRPEAAPFDALGGIAANASFNLLDSGLAFFAATTYTYAGLSEIELTGTLGGTEANLRLLQAADAAGDDLPQFASVLRVDAGPTDLLASFWWLDAYNPTASWAFIGFNDQLTERVGLSVVRSSRELGIPF